MPLSIEWLDRAWTVLTHRITIVRDGVMADGVHSCLTADQSIIIMALPIRDKQKQSLFEI